MLIESCAKTKKQKFTQRKCRVNRAKFCMTFYELDIFCVQDSFEIHFPRVIRKKLLKCKFIIRFILHYKDFFNRFCDFFRQPVNEKFKTFHDNFSTMKSECF